MTYFPNGISVEVYIESLCYRCVHWLDNDDNRGPGCPVIDLHFMWNHEALKEPHKKWALGLFIPDDPDDPTQPADCLMFHPADREEEQEQEGNHQEGNGRAEQGKKKKDQKEEDTDGPPA